MTLGHAVLTALGVVVAAGAVALSYVFAGTGATLVCAGLVWVILLIALRAALPSRTERPVTEQRGQRPGRSASYPSLSRIETAVSTAPTSARGYDIGLRPLVWRLALARTITRHGVDEHRAEQLIRDAVGEELWPWLRPAWPPSSETREGGIDHVTLRTLVRRLEEL